MFQPRKLASALALVLGCAGVAHAGSAPFDSVVVFGDSLSDAGNLPNGAGDYTRFTTNPGTVAVQNVADKLGLDLQPSRLGGNDYAYGGAGITTNSDANPLIQTVTQQVTGYLADGNRADPRALYMIWGGPNDIFYHSTQYGVGTIFPGAGETAAQATANINAAATQELTLINQLKAAGANYLVVFNLPDIGATPSAQANEALVPGIKTFLTNVSQSYNQILNAGLGDHTLAVNAYALFDQVLADPARYGFTNVAAPACTTSSSHDCDGDTLVVAGADQTYLFADGVHPSTAAHAMLGQVVLSELQAPQQISLLPEAPLAAANAYDSSLHAQMIKDSLEGGTRAFVNIGYAQQRFDATPSSPAMSSNNASLTLGYDWKTSDSLSLGAALGVGHDTAHMHGGGGYRMSDYSALGFLTYHVGGGYVSAYGHYGRSDFSSVERNFQIGAARVRETGDTNSSHYGLGVSGGWWFSLDAIKTGPFVGLDWQDITVDGYREHGDDATAMWFGRQHRQALVGRIGWRLQGHWQVANLVMAPYAELAWNRDSKADTRREVTTGLNTMNGSFAVSGFTPDKAWGNVAVGLSAELTPKVTSWVGYEGRFSDTSQTINSFNMGFRIKF